MLSDVLAVLFSFVISCHTLQDSSTYMDYSLQWKAAVRTTNLIENNGSEIISITIINISFHRSNGIFIRWASKDIEENIKGFWKWFITFEITYFMGTGLTFQGHYLTAWSGLQIRLNPANLDPLGKTTLKIIFSLRTVQR